MLMLLLAEAATATSPICTDRPTKANAVCTVPSGTVQIETSAAAWSRTDVGDATSETWTLGSTVAKVGIDRRSDFQLGFTPYVRTRAGGSSIEGIGDVVVRYKRRLSRDEAAVQVSVIPFAKIPAATRGIGNRKLEGGIALPVSTALPGSITATFGPEIDLLADGDGQGHHPALVNLVHLAAPVAPRLTLIGELWSNLNFDPAGTIKQASADVAVAYLASDRMQFDAGANIGLTRDTPDLELSVGLSVTL